MAITLRDVAQHAGVSPRTVSNVVNGYHYISPTTRTRVEASIEALNYRPNLLARSLRQGRTGIITFLVPDITVSYFGELAHEVVERASALGCTVMIDETAGEPKRECALLDIAAQSAWVDGVLLNSLGLQHNDLTSLSGTMPVVLLGERTAGSALDHVGIDNVAAARDAVRHLLASGCERVAAVGGTTRRTDVTSRLRLRGYRLELRAAGLLERAMHAPTFDYKRASGANATRSLLERAQAPDGLFCVSDELAVGALRELHIQGIRVPDEVRVVGFDDIDEAAFTTPSLTSIRPDRASIAGTALQQLMTRIDGSVDQPQETRVDYELIVRESSGNKISAPRTESSPMRLSRARGPVGG